MILLIDNYDSFTWNLVHLVAAARGGATAREPSNAAVGRAPGVSEWDCCRRRSGPPNAAATSPGIVVARNNEITVEAARALAPTHIIISPGPCGPGQAGVSVDIVREFAGRVPVLGVCLGHQCIAAAFRMRVTRLESPVHGLASPVRHDGRGLFEGLPNPLAAARYHSLVVPEEELQHGHGEHEEDGWEASAWIETPTRRVVMGLRRAWAGVNKAPVEGVQFHPESFLTEHGAAMMRRFVRDTVAP